MFGLKIISKLIKALRSGESPKQIAAGFAMGILIGIMPSWTLQGVVLLIVLIIFKVNMAAGMLGILLANLFAYPLDPLFHRLGYYVLTGITALHGLWVNLYNLPIAPLTRYNNTVVMGSFLSGLLLIFPVYFGMKEFVVLYRSRIEERIKQWRIVQMISGSQLIRVYRHIRDLGGE